MKNRSRSYYRHQRKRAVKRKLKIIQFAWGLDQRDKFEHPCLKNPGRLSKAKSIAFVGCANLKNISIFQKLTLNRKKI